MLRKIIILFISISSILTAQEKVVATLGDYNISESEFKERFDFSVHPNLLQKSDRDSIKQEFLYQLIAEKLLSMEAKEKGYDTIEVFSNIMAPLENMYVRDALYEKEIKKKVEYSQDEIAEGAQRIKTILKLKFIHSEDLKVLEKIFNQLKEGASFDSLLLLRSEAKDQVEPRAVTFGTMDKVIEDSIYKLKPGQFTKPLASKDGYYILKLAAIEKNPDSRTSDIVAIETFALSASSFIVMLISVKLPYKNEY